MMQGKSIHGQWSSRLVFLFATIGFAVGLGNIWKFPYVTGQNGGGAFVFVYLLCAVAIGVPCAMAEVLIGRRGQKSPPGAMRSVAVQEGASRHWSWVGALTMVTAYVILTYYCVIGGWAMAYVFKAASGAFGGLTGESSSTLFDSFLSGSTSVILWQGLFLVVTVAIVARGIEGGIEKAVTVMMPLLFVFLLVMVGYAAVVGDFSRAMTFLFEPDFSKISARTVLVAVGQAFFSIGIAMAGMMTYGAYLPKDVSIARSSYIVVAADTLIAVLAGVAIFPLVFAFDLEPTEGPGLIFVTLPIAFGQMPGGQFFSTLFFLLLVFAAITSSIGILEPAVSWASERKGLRRSTTALVAGALTWVLGLATVFSFNIWSDFRPLGFFQRFADMDFFTLTDHLTSNLGLPVGGLLIAVFAGWVMTRDSTLQELQLTDGLEYKAWRFLIRYVAPPAIVFVLAAGL